MSHSAKTKRGVKWSIVDQVVRQVVTLIVSAFLSRLLVPSEFGLVGMATVAIGFLHVFTDFGLGASIIHESNTSKRSLDTIFWSNVGLGLIISLTVLLLAPLIADFYKQPVLSSVLLVLAINFFINAFRIVPDALIRKAIDFKSYFFRNIGAVLISGIIAILLAYAGWGIWALIAQSLIASLANSIISFRMVSWRPSFQFDLSLLKGHLKFSLPILGETSLNYWVRNIDNLLIGKLLGAVALGYYSRAYSLMLLPVRQISGTLTQVMFPSFSLIKHDRKLVWEQYLNMISLIAAVAFPLMGGLAVFATPVIRLLYGEQWLPVVPIFRVLCFLGALQSVGTLCGSVFYSQGKTLLAFNIGLVVKPLMVAGIVTGLIYSGSMGVAWGYTLTSFTSFFIESFFVAKVLEGKLSFIIYSFSRELLATGLAILSVLAIDLLISNTEWMILQVGIKAIVFLIVYLFFCFFFNVKAVQYLKNWWNGRKTVPAYNAG